MMPERKGGKNKRGRKPLSSKELRFEVLKSRVSEIFDSEGSVVSEEAEIWKNIADNPLFEGKWAARSIYLYVSLNRNKVCQKLQDLIASVQQRQKPVEKIDDSDAVLQSDLELIHRLQSCPRYTAHILDTNVYKFYVYASSREEMQFMSTELSIDLPLFIASGNYTFQDIDSKTEVGSHGNFITSNVEEVTVFGVINNELSVPLATLLQQDLNSHRLCYFLQEWFRRIGKMKFPKCITVFSVNYFEGVCKAVLRLSHEEYTLMYIRKIINEQKLDIVIKVPKNHLIESFAQNKLHENNEIKSFCVKCLEILFDARKFLDFCSVLKSIFIVLGSECSTHLIDRISHDVSNAAIPDLADGVANSVRFFHLPHPKPRDIIEVIYEEAKVYWKNAESYQDELNHLWCPSLIQIIKDTCENFPIYCNYAEHSIDFDSCENAVRYFYTNFEMSSTCTDEGESVRVYTFVQEMIDHKKNVLKKGRDLLGLKDKLSPDQQNLDNDASSTAYHASFDYYNDVDRWGGEVVPEIPMFSHDLDLEQVSDSESVIGFHRETPPLDGDMTNFVESCSIPLQFTDPDGDPIDHSPVRSDLLRISSQSNHVQSSPENIPVLDSESMMGVHQTAPAFERNIMNFIESSSTLSRASEPGCSMIHSSMQINPVSGSSQFNHVQRSPDQSLLDNSSGSDDEGVCGNQEDKKFLSQIINTDYTKERHGSLLSLQDYFTVKQSENKMCRVCKTGISKPKYTFGRYLMLDLEANYSGTVSTSLDQLPLALKLGRFGYNYKLAGVVACRPAVQGTGAISHYYTYTKLANGWWEERDGLAESEKIVMLKPKSKKKLKPWLILYVRWQRLNEELYRL
ncbi:hypothetical protein QAD02_003285 [Eretmocerus hayati]|uniref:Uncharacterized protein n=1 Tax=Eretmocerus hayati TaxID=131215 RepID=A0ACC2NN35_9HYME|nr:hypothetical protein QAD02_003285 [Eretmocerus hayati]